ncbi:hypothetical protein AA0113_g3459 [Alternaria arborescens]|uniref:Uncharacterized protein n=1 Tax=Alternaria arborescens TaxID=156630 RepID=A0A4Q4SIS2_9PLEO|nr:hypothetical protein AA0113_g3459 [Alternaria arborescens]
MMFSSKPIPGISCTVSKRGGPIPGSSCTVMRNDIIPGGGYTVSRR